MFSEMTGSKQVLVRRGFSDYDTYGSDNYWMAATGNLDAPDHIPQGSVRIHNTLRHCPQLSLAHRDHFSGTKPIGAGHDGPEPATKWLDRSCFGEGAA